MASGKQCAMQHRFLLKIKPFDLFLKFNGVFLNPVGPAWKLSLIELWSCLGLLLNVICGANIFKYFAVPALVSVFAPGKGTSQMTSFNAFLAHITPIAFGIPTQITMIFSVRKTYALFHSSLSSLDNQLNYPNISNSLTTSCIIRVFFIVLAVGIHSSFTLSWEMFHPIRPIYWPGAIRKAISAAENVVFSLLPVSLFALFGQLLSFLHDAISEKLVHYSSMCNRSQFTFIAESIKELRILNEAAIVLRNRLGLLLFLTSGLSTVSIIITSYYFIVMANQKLSVFVLWNLFQMILHTTRLVSLCKTADDIRELPNKCIPILRKFRDSPRKLNANQRMKVTLFILEIKKNTSRKRAGLILGTLKLSRSLILKAVYALANFILIMYQFKMIEAH